MLDERDQPRQPALLERPVAQRERRFRRVALAPVLAREAPADLRLGAADLPRLGVPAQEADAAEHPCILLALRDEHADVPAPPALEPALDGPLGAGEVGGRAVADVPHRPGIGKRLEQARGVLRPRLPQHQAFGFERHRGCSQTTCGP
jgi:hypothetical protein